MKQLGNLSYSQGSPQMYGLPIEDIKNVSLELTNRYNQNKSYSNSLLQQAKAIPSIAGAVNDKKVINEAIADIQTNVEAMVNNQDFHRSSDRITTMTNDLVSNNGIKQVTQNLKLQQEDFKKIEDAKGYSDEQKNILKAKQLEEYKGVTYDKKTNTASGQYSTYDIEDAPDMKEINDIMQLFKSNKEVVANGYKQVNLSKISIPGYEGLGDHIEQYKNTKEFISEGDVKRAVLDYLSLSPKYKSYYNTISDIELYKTIKTLNLTKDDFNSNPIGDLNVLNTIKNEYKQYDKIDILHASGFNDEAIAKLSKDEKALTSVYEAAIDKMAKENIETYKSLNYKNSDIIKQEVTNKEKQKLANLYGNVVGFTKIDTDLDLKENSLFGKVFDETNKIQPFITPGMNIDATSITEMKDIYLKDIQQEGELKTKLTNLNSTIDPTIIKLQNQLKVEKDPTKQQQLKDDIKYKQDIIEQQKEALQVQLGTIEMKRKNYEQTISQAIKEHPELQINNDDLTKFNWGSNTSVLNSISDDYKKQLLDYVNKGVSLDRVLEIYHISQKERLKKELAKNPGYSLDINGSDNLIKDAYNAIHTMQSNKISKYVEAGGTISNAGVVVSMKGDKLYDGFMNNLGRAMDMNPDWKVITGSTYSSIANKDFITELTDLKVTSKDIDLYSTTQQDPTGNLLLNVTYRNEDGVPVKTVVVQAPATSVLNNNMARDLIQRINKNKQFGNTGAYSQYGTQVTNILKTSQAASIPVLDKVTGKDTGKTIGNILSQLPQIEGRYTQEYCIGDNGGIKTYLQVKKDADGYHFTLDGGIHNRVETITYQGVSTFKNPTAVLPAIYTIINGI